MAEIPKKMWLRWLKFLKKVVAMAKIPNSEGINGSGTVFIRKSAKNAAK